jgi:hypothetical protein
MTGEDKTVEAKLAEWLKKEGYPLEFTVANKLRAAGFWVTQGQYARSKSFDQPREIDVSATMTAHVGRSLVRAYHIVECKWSQEKPWVIFTDRSRIQKSALVAQTVSSKAAQSALWARAPDPRLHALSCFEVNERSGFGGRQAFASNQDQFYGAIQSLVEKAVAIAESYDDYDFDPRKEMLCVAVFPAIVVSGLLFESYFEESTGNLELRSADHIRVLWRGAGKWPFHVAVDIVRDTALEHFAVARSTDVRVLLDVLCETVAQFSKCFEQKSLIPLEILEGARGIVGTPHIVKEIRRDSEFHGKIDAKDTPHQTPN